MAVNFNDNNDNNYYEIPLFARDDRGVPTLRICLDFTVNMFCMDFLVYLRLFLSKFTLN